MKSALVLMEDGRYPTLSAAYKKLTGKDFEEAHDALSDARATAEVFWGMVDRRIVEL